MTAIGTAASVKFHLSLYASDLERSLAFYRALFGSEPATQRVDYAKFELEEPPVVLSLMAGPSAAGGAVNHVGIRVVDSAALVAMQSRLELAGFATQREENVACCYSRQTKFWVNDPDGTPWELYVLHSDVDSTDESQLADRTAEQWTASGCAPAARLVPLQPASSIANRPRDGAIAEPREAARVWHHLLIQPLPPQIPRADASLDEVRLEGTFNLLLPYAALDRFLGEVRRVLKPGGRVAVHGLVTDRELTRRPALPGPAALVEHVPLESEPARVLAAAGFVGSELLDLGNACTFRQDGAQLRELRLVAYKPLVASARPRQVVLYRGPLAEVRDERNTQFRRGERVEIDDTTCQWLRSSGIADQFVFLGDAAAEV